MDWSTVFTTIIAALTGLGGVTLGARLSRSTETHRAREERRAAAYSDYLRATAQLAHLGDPTGEDERSARILLADAKARIAIYGTEEVIAALAAFENEGAFLANRKATDSFIEAVLRMRGEDADAGRLELLLLGHEHPVGYLAAPSESQK